MAITVGASWANQIIDSITNKLATKTIYGHLFTLEDDTLAVRRYYNISGNPISGLVNTGGVLRIPFRVATTANGSPTQTITRARFAWSSAVPTVQQTCLDGFTVGLAGSGQDVELSSLDSAQTIIILKWNIKVPDVTGTVRLSAGLRSAIAQCFSDSTMVDVGLISVNGNSDSYLRIYEGSAPTSADAPATGTKLWEKVVTETQWNAASAASATLVVPLNANALANGTVGYARIENVVTGRCMQMSAGTSGTDIIVDSSTTTTGNPLNVTTATLQL